MKLFCQKTLDVIRGYFKDSFGLHKMMVFRINVWGASPPRPPSMLLLGASKAPMTSAIVKIGVFLPFLAHYLLLSPLVPFSLHEPGWQNDNFMNLAGKIIYIQKVTAQLFRSDCTILCSDCTNVHQVQIKITPAYRFKIEIIFSLF